MPRCADAYQRTIYAEEPNSSLLARLPRQGEAEFFDSLNRLRHNPVVRHLSEKGALEAQGAGTEGSCVAGNTGCQQQRELAIPAAYGNAMKAQGGDQPFRDGAGQSAADDDRVGIDDCGDCGNDRVGCWRGPLDPLVDHR